MANPPRKAKSLPTEAEILARFHRLRITIGLSATKFGYLVIGQPGLIKRLEGGHSMRVKGRQQCSDMLDELEREHSVPIPTKENEKRTKPLDVPLENIPISENIPSIVTIRSELED